MFRNGDPIIIAVVRFSVIGVKALHRIIKAFGAGRFPIGEKKKSQDLFFMFVENRREKCIFWCNIITPLERDDGTEGKTVSKKL